MKGNRIYFYIKHRFETIDYFLKTVTICLCLITKFINRYLFKTYPLIEDCGRCEDCGRNVHDFLVPNEMWKEVYGNEGGILCYDCFCNRLDEKLHYKHRMDALKWRWE